MSVVICFLFKVIILTIINLYKCEESFSKSTESLSNFRKLVEETSVENYSNKSSLDSDSNFVSFLLENAKEIFSNSEPTVETSIIGETTLNILSSPTLTTTSEQTEADEESNINIPELEDLNSSLLNTTSTDIFIEKLSDEILNFTDYNISLSKIHPDTKKATNNKTEHLLLLEKKTLVEVDQNALKPLHSLILKASGENDESHIKRSCITCDNIVSVECIDPKNKLINSKVCDREEDLCYSMHTPFGIVDRGCFDVNHNLSTYVCSCNLCNYISISEMPYTFPGKRDWLENVKELSLTKRLRKSIHKDMSCLRCEVNSTLKTGDMLDNANCLEGNINSLPMQDCDSNEICGVKAIRSEGYIWRGCLSTPLYNYWWKLCNSDLCNYDSLVSIYDEF